MDRARVGRARVVGARACDSRRAVAALALAGIAVLSGCSSSPKGAGRDPVGGAHREARLPRLLGPERGGRLPAATVGAPGPAPAGLGPERTGLRPARRQRSVRRGRRPDASEPGQPRRAEALQAARHRGGVGPGQRLLQRAGAPRPRSVQDAGAVGGRGLAPVGQRQTLPAAKVLQNIAATSTVSFGNFASFSISANSLSTLSACI